jgi:hypothetical protein
MGKQLRIQYVNDADNSCAVFVIYDSQRVAKCEDYNGCEAGTWVTLVPGYEVTGSVLDPRLVRTPTSSKPARRSQSVKTGTACGEALAPRAAR